MEKLSVSTGPVFVAGPWAPVAPRRVELDGRVVAHRIVALRGPRALYAEVTEAGDVDVIRTGSPTARHLETGIRALWGQPSAVIVTHGMWDSAARAETDVLRASPVASRVRFGPIAVDAAGVIRAAARAGAAGQLGVVHDEPGVEGALRTWDGCWGPTHALIWAVGLIVLQAERLVQGEAACR